MGGSFLFLNRFGHPFSRSGIADLLERHVAKASVAMPALRKHRIKPHTLRHTTAMHLLQSGVEVNVIRSWLGHASTTTTNGYIEIDLAMKRKALEGRSSRRWQRRRCQLEVTTGHAVVARFPLTARV
jgi:integrase/recombinase XerD